MDYVQSHTDSAPGKLIVCPLPDPENPNQLQLLFITLDAINGRFILLGSLPYTPETTEKPRREIFLENEEPHQEKPDVTDWLHRGSTTSEPELASGPRVHMNGRVYDPELGRFLSADPFIQAPANAQSFNRYSYVLNNPLSYTDPSGFFFGSLFKAIGGIFKGIVNAVKSILKNKFLRTVVAIGIMFIPGPSATLGAQMLAGFGAGFVASGGDIKAGIIGALTAGAFNHVGGVNFAKHFGDFANVAKSVAHGVVGGISSKLQGGSFLSGFASAGVAQAIGGSKLVQGLGKAGRGVARIVAGGVASVAGGGKFLNGAVTASFAYTFNELKHQGQVQSQESGCGVPLSCAGEGAGLALGGASAALPFADGAVGLTRGGDFRFYANNWMGNQHIITYRTHAAAIARPLGPLGLAVSTAVDVSKVNAGQLSSGIAGINLAGGLIGLYNPAVGIATGLTSLYGPEIGGAAIGAAINAGPQPTIPAPGYNKSLERVIRDDVFQ